MIRNAALLAALSAALLAPVMATAPSAAASQTSTTAARQGLSVSISSITPEVPKNLTDVIKFTGTVRNPTGTDMAGLKVRLRYDARKFTDRASIDTYLADQNNTTLPFNVSTRNSFMDIPSLAAGATAHWEFSATPVQLGLTQFGVYRIAVDVAQYDVPMAAQRTLLTYAPATAPRPPRNRLSFALPVIDQPHRATDDALFVDDKLEEELGAKGRLTDLLHIAQSAPASVTWVVDPALLDDLNTMTKGYKVRVKDKDEPRPASTAAREWLTTMRTALAASPIVATPYADPDVAALAHQGLDTQTQRAAQIGEQTAKTLLSANAKTSVNWPAAGVLDDDALDLLAVSGVNRVLLNSTNLPPLSAPQQPLTTTPDAATTLDSVNGPVTALVADPGLSSLFEPASSTSVVLSTQRFIAETAMISSEPGLTTPRSLVVAPSRRWNPNPTLVTALLKIAGKLPWLQLTPLESIKPTKASVPRAGLTYTEQDRKEELTRKYLDPVRDAWSKAQITAQVQTNKTPSRFDASVLRLTSSAWRNSTRAGRAVTKLVGEAVERRTEEIAITGASPDRPRTLAGSNGVVPISVKNEMESSVDLYIDVKSDNPELLQVTLTQETRRIGSGQSTTFQVPMIAASDTSGDATVTVQLRTAGGAAYGKPQRLTIRTTGYTGIALVIVGAALVVMLAAVVTRLLRRRSERKLARAKNRESESG